MAIHERPVHVHYIPGYIVLSYFISLVGCLTTLELLHRRTSRSGAYNWYVPRPAFYLSSAPVHVNLSSCTCYYRYLLFVSSVSMGGVGIWCMHFIGNRAIVLSNGEPSLQIVYDVAFTAVSFFLPVIVILTAFYAINFEAKAGYSRILFAGFLTGASVCGMHYVGQLGIANYYCFYGVGHVVGSAAIAIFSTTVALAVFFRWRDSWTDTWSRRALCSAVLALAVSGMHWTAAAGTSYVKPHDDPHRYGHRLSRGGIVTVCAVLVRPHLIPPFASHI